MERDDAGLQVPVGADVPGGVPVGVIGQVEQDVQSAGSHAQLPAQGSHHGGVGRLKAPGGGPDLGCCQHWYPPFR